MGNFGTLTNPAHYVEVPDPAAPGQVKRPDAGVSLMARDYLSGGALPGIVTTDYGYWLASYPGVDLIEVSGDGGTTWVGPLASGAGLAGSVSAGTVAAAAQLLAQQADAKAQLALDTDAGGTWASITGKPTTFPPITGTTPGTAFPGDGNFDGRYYTKAQVDAKVASGTGGSGGTLDTLPSVTRYETSPGVYPVRGTSRSDLRITWVGTVQPPIATAGSGTNFLTSGTAMDGVDAYEKI